MSIKKILIKKIKEYIQRKTAKLENLFGKEGTTEQQLLQLVLEIHNAALQLKEAKQDNYEYVQHGKGLFFYINNKRFYISQAKKEHHNI